MDHKHTNDNKPWIEKFRPVVFDEILGHEHIINTLKNFLKQGDIPNAILFGNSGSGKSSTALICAHFLHCDQFSSMVRELNASDSRGIDVIRNEIKAFASMEMLQFGQKQRSHLKIIILDEADAMTKDAQQALRRTMELYIKSVRFFIICNYSYKIIPAILSRCLRFRFSPIEATQMSKRLQLTARQENIELDEQASLVLAEIAEGDMRKALSILQSVSSSSKKVTKDQIWDWTEQPSREWIHDLMKQILSSSLKETNSLIESKMSIYSFSNLLTGIHNCVLDEHKTLIEQYPNVKFENIIKDLADIEYRFLCKGASERFQISALASIFYVERNKV